MCKYKRLLLLVCMMLVSQMIISAVLTYYLASTRIEAKKATDTAYDVETHMYSVESKIGDTNAIRVQSVRGYAVECELTAAHPESPYKVYKIDNPTAHAKKIYTEYTEVKDKSSVQYRLLYGDFDGDDVADRYYDKESYVRVITDAYGIERYCVAVGSYWAEGKIGRYIDFVLDNGNVIPCITCDVKQDIHTVGKNGKYGYIANDIIEFYTDPSKKFVDWDNVTGQGLRYKAGDVSTAKEEFNGCVVRVIVYDEYLGGFGE